MASPRFVDTNGDRASPATRPLDTLTDGIPEVNIFASFRALCWRAALLAPAAVAICYLNQPGLYRVLVFDGGWPASAYVAAWAVLTPYLGWLIIAAGRLVLTASRHTAAHSIDAFFVGAAALILGGFALGALSALFSWLVLGLAVVVLLWDTMDLKRPQLKQASYPTLLLSALAVALCADVFIDRAALPDVVSADVQQLYAPYLAEIARNHSIWLAPDNPIFADFETGHANGVHLLLATFLPPQVGQIISFLYFIAIGSVIFELAREILPLQSIAPAWERVRNPVALALAILGLASPMLMRTAAEASSPSGLYLIEFGKYHLQTAAFLIYMLLLVVRSTGDRSRLQASICGFALAISYPLYTAFVGLISALATVAKIAQRDRAGLILALLLGSSAVAGCLIAFGVNFLYLGIPATNPYSLFRHFVSVDRFARFGSTDILEFFILSQVLQVSDFLSGRGLILFARQAASIAGLAAALGLIGFIVAWLDGRLFPERGSVSTHVKENAAGLLVIAAYVALVRFLDTTLAIPSLTRLADHISALLPLVLVAAAMRSAVILRRFAPALADGHVARNLVVLVLIAACARTVLVVSRPLRDPEQRSALLFMTGTPLSRQPNVTRDWRRCEALQQLTGTDRILPLNGYRSLVPCYFSPLLQRGKIIHTYESDVARDFRKIALGTPDTAEMTLKSLGVRRFYVEKQNCDFWLNGFAEVFERDQLAARFSLFHETRDYWILSWRTTDDPLSQETASGIAQLVTTARTLYRETYGVEPFELLKHPSLPRGQKGDPHALERIFRCE